MLIARQASSILIVAALVLSVNQAAQAQAAAGASGAGFLSRDEVRALVTSKTVRSNRARDNANVMWEIKADGSFVSSSTFGGGRSVPRGDSGTWEVSDAGGLCMKFKSNQDDKCTDLFWQKQANKYILYLNRNPDTAPWGEVQSIN